MSLTDPPSGGPGPSPQAGRLLLPGGDLIAAGLQDIASGAETVSSLLVAIGARRLRKIGINVPPTPAQPEPRLYSLLAQENSDSAHGRYNALIRRLVSFERAMECDVSRSRPGRTADEARAE